MLLTQQFSIRRTGILLTLIGLEGILAISTFVSDECFGEVLGLPASAVAGFSGGLTTINYYRSTVGWNI